MNKYEVPAYKELVLSLKEHKARLQEDIDDISSDIEYYEDKIAKYEAKSHQQPRLREDERDERQGLRNL